MTDDRGFTPENVFKALLTITEATEMGFARVDTEMAKLASKSELGLSGLEQRLGAKIDNVERRIVRSGSAAWKGFSSPPRGTFSTLLKNSESWDQPIGSPERQLASWREDPDATLGMHPSRR